MVEYTFVIYGAASDIVAPIFEHFLDADFICLVNRSKPTHLKGAIIETRSDTFEHDLKLKLAEISKDRIVIFLNAAVYQKDELFVAHSKLDIEKMISVGINQTLLIVQIIIAEMLKRRKGRVINLSSFRANAPTKGTAVYSAIKSFSNTFFNAIGLEYGRFDITSNSIAIGFADSKLLDGLEARKLSQFKNSISKNKFLPKEEFLNTLEYLIASKYVNSAVIDLNGGLGLLE